MKNGKGGRGLKELIFMTHGHELGGGRQKSQRVGEARQRGDKGGKTGKTVIA